MANTGILLASNTLGSDTASVQFTGLSQTYNDLLIIASVQDSHTGINDYATLQVAFNVGGSAVGSSMLKMLNNTVSASTSSSDGVCKIDYIYTAAVGTGRFSPVQIYIPNYIATTKRVITATASIMRGTTPYGMGSVVSYYNDTTTAISSITFTSSISSLKSGSSFYIYGIKNT